MVVLDKNSAGSQLLRSVLSAMFDSLNIYTLRGTDPGTGEAQSTLKQRCKISCHPLQHNNKHEAFAFLQVLKYTCK
jgi:hypothetical protein